MKKFRVEIKLKGNEEKNNLTLILQSENEETCLKERKTKIWNTLKDEEIEIQIFEI